MKNIKSLIINLAVPLALGGIGALISGGKFNLDSLNKPALVPPAIVFPIVWSILYILMGISAYLICQSNSKKEVKKEALTFYYIQLVLNSLWSFIFFKLKWFAVAFIWILAIITFLVITLFKFYKIDKRATYLNIPYLLWLIFASILNLQFYILN